MYETNEYQDTLLTEDLAVEIATLVSRSFQASTRPLEERINNILMAVGSDNPEKTTGRRFVIRQDGRAVAHASTFVRHIFVGQQEIPVLALAAVCCDPDIRGHGLGAKVTQLAFQQVGKQGWPELSLFQSPVPVFYEMLNCRLVTNRFVNRLNAADPEANPWRDENVMIYPNEFQWPDGVVDLNGPDY